MALSTLSQLGVMFIILGMGQPILAFFHLVIHALFKSTLFMCAGFLIHNTRGRQDGRFGGFFSLRSPVLGVVFGCTNLALCGFPFMAGFYSKDSVLENVFRRGLWFSVLVLVVIATGLTVSYSIRVVYLRRGKSGKINSLRVSRDFDSVLMFRSFFLFFLRVVGGFFFSWVIVIKGGVFVINIFEKFYILLVVSFFLMYMVFFMTKNFSLLKSKLFLFFSRVMVFLPGMRGFLLPKFIFFSGGKSRVRVDKGWLEYIGPQGVSSYLFKLRNRVQRGQMVVIFTQFFLFFILLFFFLLAVVCLKSSKSVALKMQMCKVYFKQKTIG